MSLKLRGAAVSGAAATPSRAPRHIQPGTIGLHPVRRGTQEGSSSPRVEPEPLHGTRHNHTAFEAVSHAEENKRRIPLTNENSRSV
jgi:hypothetical protein